MVRAPRTILAAAAFLAFALPAPAQPDASDAGLIAVAKAIAAACPASEAAKGVPARDACAVRLGRLKALAAVSGDSLVWGATENSAFDPATDKLTRLDAFVWRKLYLSLFAFTGTYRIETLANGDRLLRLDESVRPIPPEEFPYPFWHSAAKWRDYQQSRQIGLLFRCGRLIAAYRNAAIDPAKVFAPKPWDGNWALVDGKPGPRVALYGYALSPGNPARAALETAYRDFEQAARPFACTGCHNPGNPAGINPLVFFTHPSQALVARHDIVTQLEANRMPPPGGIADDAARQALIGFAKRFAAEGDRALDYEKSRTAR